MNNSVTKNRFEKGYTLAEILVVVAIIGFIAAVSIAAFSNYLKMYRLTTDTRKLAAAIQLTRMKAVSRNMVYTLNLNAGTFPNTFQITGTNDINGNSTCEPWEDMFGDGLLHPETVYAAPQPLNTAKIAFQGISQFPNGVGSSAVMSSGAAQNIVFDGRGLVRDHSIKQYILLQNQGNTAAIFLEFTGPVHMYRYTNPGWPEFK